MSDYTVDDLLLLLDEEEPEKAPLVTFESKIGEFLDEMKITDGVDRLPNFVVYYTYKEVFGGELSKIEFFRQFKKEGFTQVRTGKQRCYMLDGSSFDLSREGIIKAKFFNNK